MTCRRTPPITRRAAWAVAVACALGGPAVAADPVPSRAYPPTYSSRKAPWYDPFRIFTDQRTAGNVVPAGQVQSKPIPAAQVEPGAAGATPAWKWYGYGTPVPANSPPATVPANWYTASGATPGAVPGGPIGTVPGLVPDPVPGPPVVRQESTFASSPDGPDLPTPVNPPPPTPPAPDANWSAATLRPPTPDPAAPTADSAAPAAVLKLPVREVEATRSGPTLGTPIPMSPPAAPPAESPDLPVVPAPGIIVPPLKAGVSSADRPLTARVRAPELDPIAVVRRACGSGVRVMDISPAGPRGLVVRLAGTADAIRAAADQLAGATELAGWRIDIERVTALRP